VEPAFLYLDTARLGRMSPRAQAAHSDYARLAGSEGGSLFLERFLRHGVDADAGKVERRYPGLAGWRGVGPLKQALRSLAGSQPDLPVLIANRSAQLMKLAARLLFHPCRNVLVTDLSWPAYHDILDAEARRASKCVTTVPVLQDILAARVSEDEVVERLRAEFLRRGCDGLFLTAVSNRGIRLPVERAVRSIEAAAEVRFVVLDGAQDFCHVSADLRNEYCDLYLAGSHKWLRAYHPMGLGFYGHRRSRSYIETVLAHLLGSGELDDPLLTFSGQLEQGALNGTAETVSLACLFACQGAADDALAATPPALLPQRLSNWTAAADVALATGWRPLRPGPAFRSGILLLETERNSARLASAEEVREAFYSRGVALTAYPDGVIRLSMPEGGWRPGELEHLQTALRQIPLPR
jgi:hypothetical protein